MLKVSPFFIFNFLLLYLRKPKLFTSEEEKRDLKKKKKKSFTEMTNGRKVLEMGSLSKYGHRWFFFSSPSPLRVRGRSYSFSWHRACARMWLSIVDETGNRGGRREETLCGDVEFSVQSIFTRLLIRTNVLAMFGMFRSNSLTNYIHTAIGTTQ